MGELRAQVTKQQEEIAHLRKAETELTSLLSNHAAIAVPHKNNHNTHVPIINPIPAYGAITHRDRELPAHNKVKKK